MATLVGTTRPPRLAIVGASAPAVPGTRNSFAPAGARQNLKGHHQRLWDIYEALGPVHAAVQFRRQSVLRAKFYPGQITDPDTDPDPVNDGPVRRQFDRLDGGRGKVASVVADASVQWDVVGECFLIWTAEEELDVYSTLVIEPVKGGWQRVSGRNVIETYDANDLVVRLWRASPRDPEMPDSHLRPIAEQAEELLALGRMIRATVLSKTNAGIAYIPDELLGPEAAPTPPDMIGTPAPEPQLIRDIKEHWRRPIEDPGSMSSVGPLLVNGPAAFAEALKRVDFSRSVTAEEAALRGELLQWMAIGLDLPPETVTGSSGLNDWSKLMVDIDAYKQHVDPTVLEILDGINRDVWWPMLAAAGIREPEEFVIWRDLSQLVASPSAFNDSLAAFDRGIVTAEAVRRRGGFSDSDAPDEVIEDEQADDRQEGEETPTTRPDEAPEPEGPRDSPRAPGGPGTPPGERSSTGSGLSFNFNLEPWGEPAITATVRLSGKFLTQIDQGTMSRLLTLSRAEHGRALDRAGARARNKIKKDRDAIAATAEKPNSVVCMTLGPNYLWSLQLTENDLVIESDFDGFRAQVIKTLTRAVDQTAREVEKLTGEETERDYESERVDIERGAAMVVEEVVSATRRDLFTPQLEPDPAEVGEIDEGPINSRAIGSAMTVAGGGQALVANADGSGYDYGIGNGARASVALAKGGLQVSGMVWVYGDPSSRAANFEPHMALDGVEFLTWDDTRLEASAFGHMPNGAGAGQIALGRVIIDPETGERILAGGKRVPPPEGAKGKKGTAKGKKGETRELSAREKFVEEVKRLGEKWNSWEPEAERTLRQGFARFATKLGELEPKYQERFVRAINAVRNPEVQLHPEDKNVNQGRYSGYWEHFRAKLVVVAGSIHKVYEGDGSRPYSEGPFVDRFQPHSSKRMMDLFAHELGHVIESTTPGGLDTWIGWDGRATLLAEGKGKINPRYLWYAKEGAYGDDRSRQQESFAEAMMMYVNGIGSLSAAQWRETFPQTAAIVERILVPPGREPVRTPAEEKKVEVTYTIEMYEDREPEYIGNTNVQSGGYKVTKRWRVKSSDGRSHPTFRTRAQAEAYVAEKKAGTR